MSKLHLCAYRTLSWPQRSTLQDATQGPLTRFRLGWQRDHLSPVHNLATVRGLMKRGYLAEEHGMVVLTHRGRALLATAPVKPERRTAPRDLFEAGGADVRV